MSNSIRETFGLELVKLGHVNDKIVAVSADLKGATKLIEFFKAFPERSFEVGISEANAIGIAAGLGLSGFKPVVASFGSFLTGKNVEIRTSIAFNKSPVLIVGTHGGLIGPDGPTQAGLQDIAVMRSMPNMKVFQPATHIETAKILEYCIHQNEPIYLRISRQQTKEFFKENYKFEEGEPVVVNDNFSDVLIFTSGNELERSIEASKMLADKFNIGVVNIPSIKPLNFRSIIDLVSKTKMVITVEDHLIDGGLGSAIYECTRSSFVNKPFVFHGLYDCFTQSGSVEELYKHYNLDANGISEIIIDNYSKFKSQSLIK